MKKFNIGDIVFVSKYVYKDGSDGENHSFVLVDDGQVVDINYFGFLLSSNLDKQTYPYNERISKNSQNGLKYDSIVKCDDLINVSENNIKFKIGSVDQNDLDKFIDTYSSFIEEN